MMTEWHAGTNKRHGSSTDLGGTMRLGAYPCRLAVGTLAEEAYGTTEITERHRHRYEFNPQYREALESAGLVFSGVSPTDPNLVEIIELPKTMHPSFFACQYHPEFKSQPLQPHPLFAAFIGAAVGKM
jgi:CTP synthase